jgi:hypothetical protein
MSGYGGRPPGWQDPYDPYQQQPPPQGHPGQPPGWQDPYGGAPPGYQYGGYGYGYGYGPPGMPGPPRSNGSTIGALVCNVVACVLSLFCCFGLLPSIPGIILAGIAMGRTQTDPESARKLTMWAWICFGLTIVVTVGLIVTAIALGRSPQTTYPSA